MTIKGIDGWTQRDIDAEVAAGGRFVFYEYCISLLVLTLRKPTAIYFLPAGDEGVVRGLPFVLVSLLLGWWGIPWGVVYTPMAIISNLGGGRDVTRDVLRALRQEVVATKVVGNESATGSEAVAVHADDHVQRSQRGT